LIHFYKRVTKGFLVDKIVKTFIDMYVTKSISAGHEDLIHDVAYDFYGRRMATCSSDQKVKIFDQDSSGNWVCTASWQSHHGSVWKVTWAHPEFGQVIATCSFDRSAKVWEEIVGEKGEGGQNHWVVKTSLVDSRTSVTDVKFAPKHLGLMLATSSADGVVRIYEAPDVMNLSQWSLRDEINIKMVCSCITWNPSLSRQHNPLIAVGSDESSSSNSHQGKVKVYEYSDTVRRWQLVETFSTISDPVHDIAFAPNIGRSYHVLAVASKDLRIVTLKPSVQGDKDPASVTKFDIRQAGQFEDHNSVVWRVCWNITGTILATSSDDGKVKLWKANYFDNWKCVSTLAPDASANITNAEKDIQGLGSSLTKQGFSKLPMSCQQSNWH